MRKKLVVVSHTGVLPSDRGWLVAERVGEVVSRLAELGWDVTLVAREKGMAYTCHPVPPSVTVVAVGVPRSVHGVRSWLRAARSLARARGALVFMPSVFSAVCAVLLGRRALVYAGGSWALRADFSGRHALLEALAARRVSRLVVHGDALRAHFARFADEVELAVPHVHAEVARRLAENATFKLDGHDLRVLFVGGLNRLKGVPEFLEAARSLRDAEFRIVGHVEDDAVAAEVEQTAAAVPNLTVSPYLEWQGLREAYQWANVLALPSHTEGFPRVVYEAAAFGLALVVTPVGGIPARLTDGRDALFIPVADADALTRALSALRDPQQRARLATAARVTLAPSLAQGDSASQFDRYLRMSRNEHGERELESLAGRAEQTS